MTKNKIATSLIAAFLATTGATAFACMDGEPGSKCGGGAPVVQEAPSDAAATGSDTKAKDDFVPVEGTGEKPSVPQAEEVIRDAPKE